MRKTTTSPESIFMIITDLTPAQEKALNKLLDAPYMRRTAKQLGASERTMEVLVREMYASRTVRNGEYIYSPTITLMKRINKSKHA